MGSLMSNERAGSENIAQLTVETRAIDADRMDEVIRQRPAKGSVMGLTHALRIAVKEVIAAHGQTIEKKPGWGGGQKEKK
ncbi:MAG: hypothetical protein ACEQSK_11785 [Sphingomonadaceae bacterium]